MSGAAMFTKEYYTKAVEEMAEEIKGESDLAAAAAEVSQNADMLDEFEGAILTFSDNPEAIFDNWGEEILEAMRRQLGGDGFRIEMAGHALAADILAAAKAAQ